MIGSRKNELNRMVAEMKLERDSYIGHWQDICSVTRPRQEKFFLSTGTRGQKRHQHIYNNTPMHASRTLSAGMMSGVTSPARPWFKLSTGDLNTDEMDDVKEWLHQVSNRMREVFAQSNLYSMLPAVYADLGDYGTAGMTMVKDDENIVHFSHEPIGSFMIGTDERGRVNRLAREMQKSVFQLVAEFSKDKCSSKVQAMFDGGQLMQRVDVVHVIHPNKDFKKGAIGPKGKRFASCYYERGGEGEDMLREAGFDRFPAFAPRWSVNGDNVYGDSCGMESLGDARALQAKEKRKQQMIEKGANPPLAAPSQLRNQRVSLLPGDVSFLDIVNGQQKLEPIYQPDPRWLSVLETDIGRDEMRIQRAYFVDLFLMLAQLDGVQPRNQMEIAERKEEKLLQLGPVMDRLNDELFDPLISMTFDFMVEESRLEWDAGLPGMIPQPPESMQDKPLRVEYTSIMAQAMKAVGLGGIERFVGFIGNVAAAQPEIMDVVDMDEGAREYHKNMGLAPKIIRSREVVDGIRQQRAQAMQAQQAAEMAKTAGQAVQSLASAEVSPDNALSRVLGNLNPSGETLPI